MVPLSLCVKSEMGSKERLTTSLLLWFTIHTLSYPLNCINRIDCGKYSRKCPLIKWQNSLTSKVNGSILFSKHHLLQYMGYIIWVYYLEEKFLTNPHLVVGTDIILLEVLCEHITYASYVIYILRYCGFMLSLPNCSCYIPTDKHTQRWGSPILDWSKHTGAAAGT